MLAYIFDIFNGDGIGRNGEGKEGGSWGRFSVANALGIHRFPVNH